MLRQINDTLFCWSELHGIGSGQYSWNSYAIRIPGTRDLLLIDPLPLSCQEIRDIELIGVPTKILLSCEYHLRDSVTHRDRWNCDVIVNSAELGKYEVSIDGVFGDGHVFDTLIQAGSVPGIYFEETAFLVKQDKGYLIVGEMLSGARADRRIADGVLAIAFPEYIADKAEARRSIEKLLCYDFAAAYFGHGSPVLDNPKAKMESYLQEEVCLNESGTGG